MPRPPRPSSAQSVPSSDVIDMAEGCHITNALQENALVLHQMTLTQGVVDPSDPRCLEALVSPGEMSGACPSSSSSRNSSRSACILAPTFTKNQEHTNAVASQHCEGVKEQHPSVNTRLGAQVAFVDDYPCKSSELLNREASNGSNDIPQVGTSAVLA